MYSVEPVATIRSCYTQRFGIPRQAGLVTSAAATIVFENNHYNELSLRGLDAFSHIWVIFIFHAHHYPTPKPLVQPPRLGGKKNVGVYATRSPNRRNSIGLSCVELSTIGAVGEEIHVNIRGGDFLDGTPVLDLKPYVAFADSVADARCGWAEPITDSLPVTWTDNTIDKLRILCRPDSYQQTVEIIEDSIAQDPRPAYERNKDGKPGQQWHMKIFDFDISFEVCGGTAIVVDARALPEAGTADK